MPDKFIETCFPACADDGYTETSPATYEYNCIAWAAGVTDIPWWPILKPGVFWPLEIPQKIDLVAFLRAYETLGYQECDNGSLEPAFEKIALYQSNNGSPTHAARQLPDGKWTSKLGTYKDITHATPAALETSARGQTAYGNVVKFMRRTRA